jgi:hypothetical protein
MARIRKRTKSMRLRAGAAVIAVLVVILVAYLIGSRSRARKGQMVTMDAGLMTIRDYDAWFNVLPTAIRAAMRRNNPNAEAILADVFSSILPNETWPPPAGSPQRWQWTQMLEQTRALLEPPPRRPTPERLRVVRPNAIA